MNRTLLVVALLCVASCSYTPAFAVDAVVVAAPAAKAVIIPWGDWIVAGGQTLTAVILPFLATAATYAIATAAPWAKLFISDKLVETMVTNALNYSLNAVAGAVKGQALTVPVGSQVLAAGVQRAVDQAPRWLLEKAGGPAGVAEKLFRMLHLKDDANAANTLAPVLAAIPSAKPAK